MAGFGARLKAARERAGLTQPELGAAVGVARNTIATWEGSEQRKLDASILAALARALRVSANYLVGTEDSGGVTDLNEAGVRAYLRGKGLTRADAEMILELIEDRRRRRAQEREGQPRRPERGH